MGKFEELNVWKNAKELAVLIYKLTAEGKLSKDFGLRDQIRRSAVSIPSNIAEGDELRTNKQSIQFFYISKGSAAELYTQLTIAFEIGYLDKDLFSELIEKCRAISAMLSKLIEVRSKSFN